MLKCSSILGSGHFWRVLNVQPYKGLVSFVECLNVHLYMVLVSFGDSLNVYSDLSIGVR